MTTNINIQEQSVFLILYEKLQQVLQSANKQDLLTTINPSNLFTLITFIMSVIDKCNGKNGVNLTGNDKKQMVLNLIYDIIEKNKDLTQEQKEYILRLLDTVFDPLVENIIDVSKGKFDINKVKKWFTSCIFTCCKTKNATV